MFNLSLTACSFHFRKTNSRGNESVLRLNAPFLFLDDAGEEIHFDSVLSLFELFFQYYTDRIKDVDKQQTFRCEYLPYSIEDTDEFVMIYSRIFSGIYGSSSDILDGETQELKLQKTSTDIEDRPFYLFVVIPKDSDDVCVQKGMLIFQNVGALGIKTVTTEYMQRFFSQKFGITIKCMTIASDLFIRKVIHKDSIKKLVLVKNMRSADGADNYANGYGKEVREIGDLNFSESAWDKIMDGIRWVAGNRYRLFEFEQKEYDALKIVVDIGGRTRKINLSNLEYLSIIEAIPDDIRMADGHPNKEKLIKYFKTVASEYLSEMVLTIG